MRPSSYYDRVVDVMEELVKIALLTRGSASYLTNRQRAEGERSENQGTQQTSSEIAQQPIPSRN